METSYVTEVDGAYRITGSRVSLDSVVYDFLSGLSPESCIADPQEIERTSPGNLWPIA